MPPKIARALLSALEDMVSLSDAPLQAAPVLAIWPDLLDYELGTLDAQADEAYRHTLHAILALFQHMLLTQRAGRANAEEHRRALHELVWAAVLLKTQLEV